MEKLLQYLTGFNPIVTGAQYALGGNWEDAVKVDLSNPNVSIASDDVDATVAVEVFYELSDKRMIFLGLRYTDDLKLTKNSKQFLLKALEIIGQAKHLGLRELLGLLGEALNDDTQTYIAKTIQYVELGVEGFWKSEGSLVLRKVTEPALHKDSLEKLLQPHSHLVENLKNNTALEFAIDKPEAWIGVQVSNQEGEKFKTNTDSLLTLSNLI